MERALAASRSSPQDTANRSTLTERRGPGYFKDLGTTALSCVQSLIRALRNLKGSTLESLLSFFAESLVDLSRWLGKQLKCPITLKDWLQKFLLFLLIMLRCHSSTSKPASALSSRLINRLPADTLPVYASASRPEHSKEDVQGPRDLFHAAQVSRKRLPSVLVTAHQTEEL